MRSYLYTAFRLFSGDIDFARVRRQAKRLSGLRRQAGAYAALNTDSSADNSGPSFGGLASSVGVTP
jgi:hypothetical protein